jgi:alpha-tubulin suppressor-like RCC1 family protein
VQPMVATGQFHTAAIRTDGTLWTWGGNANGQLGSGTTVDQTSPVQIGSNTTWTSVAAGDTHTVALRADGTLWAWGGNVHGQLGDGTTALRLNPVQIGSNTTWTSVAAGGIHTLARRADGTLWAWGNNANGQLGDGTTVNKSSPVQVGSNTTWTSVAVGQYHAVARRADGTLWAWGLNTSGQLGDGTTTQRNSPVQIGSNTTWTSVAAGQTHTVARRADGTLWAWGFNADGQLGDGTAVDKSSPVQIGSNTTWTSVAAGGSHTLALRADGTLWAWGRNTLGQLGDGTIVNKSSPVQIGSNATWTSAAAGFRHTVAVRADGTLWAWGRNDVGQLGDSTTVNKSSPVQISSNFKRIMVAAGGFHTVALRANGTLWAWGDNSYGQLGDGTAVFKTSPVQVGSNTTWTSVAAGEFHTLALRADGTLWAWGRNTSGQLGDGTTADKSSPVQIGSNTTWTSVAASQFHTVALRADGTLWAWGGNIFGQLGDGTSANKSSPVQIGINTTWTSVAAGDIHTVALRADGTLWAWGNNAYGQLGDGTIVNKFSPVQVGSNTTWMSLAAGQYHTVALRADGTLWAWGNNAYGQLGDGTTVDKSSPIQIGSNTTWTSVAAGEYHTVALRADGTLWAWGRNNFGQLGDGTTVDKSSPIQIGSNTTWTSVATIRYHTVALRADGTLWAWGVNGDGRVGDGTTTQRTSPVQIGLQAITFGAAPSISIGTGGTVSATGGASGNPVIFTSTTTSICTVSGTNGSTVTGAAAGSCVIAANQAGNAMYNAAPQVTQNITINQVSQTITGFNPASPVAIGAPAATLTATGGASGNLIVFGTTSLASICTVTGGNQVNFVGAGSCNLTADQAGDANYSAAPQVTASIVIGQGSQTITGFAPASPVAVGAPATTLTATGGASGVAIVFGTTSAGTICTVAGNQVTFVGAGTCNLTANQAGNANYTAAPQVTASIVIGQGSQTITGFTPASPVAVGAPAATLTATGGASGVAIVFATTSANTICTVTGGNQVNFVGAGTCNLTANQAGNANYTAAPQVTASIVIGQGSQTITGFTPASPVAVGAPAATLTATGGASGVAIVFSTTSAGTICTVAGNQVTFVGVGTCNLTANQAGNANYTAAPQVTASIVINQGSQTINFAATPASVLNNSSPFTVSATATSGLTVFFTSTTPGICTSAGVNGATITVTGTLGTCTIRAAQAGNANFSVAPNVDRNINVVNAPPPPPTQTTAVATLVSSTLTTTVGYGIPITLTGQIIGNAPTGTVNFSAVTAAGNTVICANVGLSTSGAASCAVPRTSPAARDVGDVTYIVNYGGDTNNTSASASLQMTITTANVILSVTASPVKPVAGQNVILTALLASDDPTGTVTFSVGNSVLSECSVVSAAILPGQTGDPDAAVATCTLANITAGIKDITVNTSRTTNREAAQAKLSLEVFADGPKTDYSDMWWAGQAENGWGLSIAQKGSIQFNAFYVYDAAGKPVWTVMPGGQWNTSGTPYTVYTGLLYQPTSAPFTQYDTSQFKPGASVGNAAITFTDANTATLRYTINGVTITKQIVRQPFGATDNSPRMIVNDLWWAGTVEDGWGINIAQQARTLFMVWYTYGQDGKTIWMTVPGGTWSGTLFTGDIYNTNSSAWFGVPYDATLLNVTKVGSVTIDFEDANKAIMTTIINGVTQTKVIVRQPF